jgi:hypothetical protein
MKSTGTTGCGRNPARNERYLSELNLTLEEQIVLTVARHFFHSFARPNSMAWLNALGEAEARFGRDDGPRIASRILVVLQSVRRARKSVFMFNPSTCPCCSAIATEHERRLMVAVHAMRRDDRGQARLEMLLLCEGNPIEEVLASLSELGAAMDHERPVSRSASRPRIDTRIV